MFVSGEEIEVASLEPEPKIVLGSGRPSKKSLADAQRKLNDDQLRLAVWLSVPESARKPATKKELAAVMGVTEVTLHRWCKIPDVILATRWLQLNHAGDSKRVSDVLDFLYTSALNQDLWMKDRLAAAKEWLKAVGVHEVWKKENELLKVKSVDDFDLDSLSDEELWDLYSSRSRSLGKGDDFTEKLVTGE